MAIKNIRYSLGGILSVIGCCFGLAIGTLAVAQGEPSDYGAFASDIDRPEPSDPYQAYETRASCYDCESAPYSPASFDSLSSNHPVSCNPAPCNISRPRQCGCNRNSPGGFYGGFDYLVWWVDGAKLPPLVTTSPNTVSRSEAGVLGETNTSILAPTGYGDGRAEGNRITLGKWFNACETVGLEASWLSLGEPNDESDFDYASDGTGLPILARPFYDVSTGVEASELVAFPGVLSGRVTGAFDREIHSGSLVLRKNFRRCRGSRTDWIAGYRYFGLDESLSISEQLTSINTGGLIPVGTEFNVVDRFQTKSDFHGFEMGVLHQINRRRWLIKTRAKLAIGNVRLRTTVDGESTVTVPSVAPVTTVGGLLAQPTNIGETVDNRVGLVPEVGIDLKYRLTDHLTASFGYSFMYHSRVLRVGDQIDPLVNSTQIGGGTLAGAPNPNPRTANSDIWLQGLNFGLELGW